MVTELAGVARGKTRLWEAVWLMGSMARRWWHMPAVVEDEMEVGWRGLTRRQGSGDVVIS